jgi:dehydrogenase/reductase SDR family member 4
MHACMYGDKKNTASGLQENQTALKRLGTASEIAAAAAFLVSEDAAYVTGENLVVAGGMQSRL